MIIVSVSQGACIVSNVKALVGALNQEKALVMQQKLDVANVASPTPHDVLAGDPLVTMLLLAVLLSLIILVVTLTVVFVAVKLFAHFRAVSQAEEDGRYNNILKTLSWV